MKKIKYITIPALLLVIIIAVLINNKSKLQAKSSVKITDVNYVNVEPVSSEELRRSLSLVGTIVANNDVNIVSETQGKVTGVFTEIGDYKNAGTVLVQVDDEMKKAAFMSAEANFEKAKKDYERFQGLYKQGAATDAQLDAANLAKVSAESQYIIAKKQFNDAKITTPISGYVTSRLVDLGTMVQPGMVIANVVDISTLKVKLNVAERDVFNLKVGEPVEVVTDVYPGVSFKGKISTISSKADDAHTYPVEVVLSNQTDHKLKAGMFATVNFNSVIDRTSLVIPRSSLVGSVKVPQVYVVENGIAKLRDIVTGIETNGMIEVISGLNKGEQLVVDGQTNLVPDAKVEIVNR